MASADPFMALSLGQSCNTAELRFLITDMEMMKPLSLVFDEPHTARCRGSLQREVSTILYLSVYGNFLPFP